MYFLSEEELQSTVVSSRHEDNLKLMRQVDLSHERVNENHFIKSSAELVLCLTLWKYRVILSCNFDYNGVRAD